jgi:hypothetical protein
MRTPTHEFNPQYDLLSVKTPIDSELSVEYNSVLLHHALFDRESRHPELLWNGTLFEFVKLLIMLIFINTDTNQEQFERVFRSFPDVGRWFAKQWRLAFACQIIPDLEKVLEHYGLLNSMMVNNDTSSTNMPSAGIC